MGDIVDVRQHDRIGQLGRVAAGALVAGGAGYIAPAIGAYQVARQVYHFGRGLARAYQGTQSVLKRTYDQLSSGAPPGRAERLAPAVRQYFRATTGAGAQRQRLLLAHMAKRRRARASRRVPRKYRGFLRTKGYYRFTVRSACGPARELKFTDSTFAAIANQTGNNCLATMAPAVAQGVGQSQRIGRKLWVESIQIKGCLTMSGLSNESDAAWRIVGVWDTQTNGAATAALTGSILDTAGGTGQNVYMGKLLSEGTRYQVFLDELGCINTTHASSWTNADPANSTTVTHAGVAIPINFYKKMHVCVEYNGATGAVAEMKTNSFNFYIQTSTATANQIQMAGVVRVRFRD